MFLPKQVERKKEKYKIINVESNQPNGNTGDEKNLLQDAITSDHFFSQRTEISSIKGLQKIHPREEYKIKQKNKKEK